MSHFKTCAISMSFIIDSINEFTTALKKHMEIRRIVFRRNLLGKYLWTRFFATTESVRPALDVLISAYIEVQ